MPTQQQKEEVEVTSRRALALERALDHELPGSIEMGGSILIGLSIKYSVGDVLLTIRAINGKDSVVAFVGSDSLTNCVLKAVRDAQNDRLRWKADRYASADV